jgi:hypothetical protein
VPRPSSGHLLGDRRPPGSRPDPPRPDLTRPGPTRPGPAELRVDLDIDAAIDALYGALYYRLLVSHAPLSPDYASSVVDVVFPGLAAPALA